jgi:uncharacterized protein (TIGR01370 family)
MLRKYLSGLAVGKESKADHPIGFAQCVLMPKLALPRWIIFSVLTLLCPCAYATQPSVALFYGDNPPWDELHAFDVVVVEPLHVPDPKLYANKRTALFAYVSVGEVSPGRAYMTEIPNTWKLGQNTDWGSIVLDQSQPEWRSFFVNQVIKPLWDAGYRGFFLDTLDSYHRFALSESARAKQEAGMVAVIQELKRRYPQAQLIFNRGFEILPQVHHEVFAVAAESLFQGWNQSKNKYRTVTVNERDWMLVQLKRVKQEYGLPIIAIDYVSPDKRGLARETVSKIRELGFIPWVTNPQLNMLGVGETEVMPRKVMMIHNTADTEYDLINTSALHYGTLPLNYLGYSVEYQDARQSLPNFPMVGRYAGIVVWLDKPAESEGAALATWINKQTDAGVPVVILGDVSFLSDSGAGTHLGMQYSTVGEGRTRLHIAHSDPLIGFEAQPVFDRTSFFPLQAVGGNALLTLLNERGDKQDAVALTAWGGYAVNPHVLIELPGVASFGLPKDTGRNLRWVINPIEFMRRALKLPDMPVPDVTTESGSRMLMVHMDGDGFANKAEFPGAPYSADVLIELILKKYPLPSTLSVIQGEVAANGLYPAQSEDLERIARKMFELPQVEIASHSLSHPFIWHRAESDLGDAGYHLDLPNYTFDLQKEIAGSISYINSKLAPAGKYVKTFLWTGDCNIGTSELELAGRSNVASMNGGETMITRSFPTLTLVSPLGVPRNKFFQVYAPNQNENLYTNNWRGPFYGYERVIETFELTNSPYRLKPIDIYFHTYSASKPASLKALDKVFKWAIGQETSPVYVSEYVGKVMDFNHMVVARTYDGWLVRGNENLRELRAPLVLGQPVIEERGAIAGFKRQGDSLYLHTVDSESNIRFRKTATASPYLVSANARVALLNSTVVNNGKLTRIALSGHVPLRFSLSMNIHCSVRAEGKLIQADSRANGVSQFSLNSHAIDELRIHCPR